MLTRLWSSVTQMETTKIHKNLKSFNEYVLGKNRNGIPASGQREINSKIQNRHVNTAVFSSLNFQQTNLNTNILSYLL